ncbi:hypothetical protein [Pseudaeromonas paramecii]|uniref:Glycosyltransferase n=1 Tax=Pseudaeromonas paramecii TaxID=2138166 RepID=A0ABP8Q542_9GAMM
MPAPIILFVYNRADHTAKTLAALEANAEFAESPLFIFSDAAKNSAAESAVQQVREVIAPYASRGNTYIHLNETNQGLAKNIVHGVTQVINQYGRAIVLEDDIIVSPHFLSFMNRALAMYADDKRVWHINGWSHPIDTSELGGAYFSPLMNCWGWATWADRWQAYHKEPAKLIATWSLAKIRRFNLNNSHDFWGQVLDNYRGHLNTWAIFWYATIFEQNGLCLTPTVSLTHNIGFDGSGENCVDKRVETNLINLSSVYIDPSDVVEISKPAIEKIASHIASESTFIDKLKSYFKAAFFNAAVRWVSGTKR